MNDEQMQSVLDEWFDDTDPQPPNVQRTASHVMSRVPQTRQRGRWLPFRLFRLNAPAAITTDTAKFQPSPIPATNDHTPTVIGRTQSMFSPAKAITAGAIVFAIGGVMLIAQPFQQQSTMPGAATDEGRAAPVEFSGTWFFGGAERLAPSETDGDPGTGRGGAWYLTGLSMTDARFGGEVTIFDNLDEYSDGHVVFGDAWRVENADGAWQSEPGYSVDFADGSNSGLTAVFHGEDGYAGLVAVVDMELVRSEGGDNQYWDLNGVIFDGDLPPEPEARSLP
jgi:hypothetical protein